MPTGARRRRATSRRRGRACRRSPSPGTSPRPRPGTVWVPAPRAALRHRRQLPPRDGRQLRNARVHHMVHQRPRRQRQHHLAAVDRLPRHRPDRQLDGRVRLQGTRGRDRQLDAARVPCRRRPPGLRTASSIRRGGHARGCSRGSPCPTSSSMGSSPGSIPSAHPARNSASASAEVAMFASLLLLAFLIGRSRSRGSLLGMWTPDSGGANSALPRLLPSPSFRVSVALWSPSGRIPPRGPFRGSSQETPPRRTRGWDSVPERTGRRRSARSGALGCPVA